jgi:hypothetical protein
MIMGLEIFGAMLVLTLAIVVLPMRYLRSITRKVLLELCDRSETGAEFWLRTSDVLAIAGSFMLVLIFVRPAADPVEAVRITLILALLGVFVTVMFVTSNIWRRVLTNAEAAAPSAALPDSAKPVSPWPAS